MDNRIVVFMLLFGSVVLAAVVGISIADESYLLLAIILFCGGLFLSLIYPRSVTIACIVLMYSGIAIPQMAGKLAGFHMAAAALFALVSVRMLMQRSQPVAWSPAHAWLLTFAAVILLTMFVRGAGLRALGDSKWGGMFYIQLMLTMSLVFTIPQLNLSASAWRPVLVVSLVMSFLPAIAEVAYIVSGGRFEGLFGFVRPNDQIMQSMRVLEGAETGVVRFTSMAAAGTSLLTILMLFIPIGRLISFRAGIFLVPTALSFVLTGFGGYRTQMISMVVLIIVMMIWNKCLDFFRILTAVIFFSLLYSVALIFGKEMPQQIQRMVSFLPGVEVDGVVKADATSTLDWRFALWERGVQSIPKYLLVGKGYAFSGQEIMQIYDRGLMEDSTEWAVVISAYHQGLLSLCVGLGLPGLITGLALYVGFIRRHMRFQREEWPHGALKLCHQVYTAVLITSFIRFCLIYGDVQSSFPDVFYDIAILEGMALAGTGQRAGQTRRSAGRDSSRFKPVVA